MIEKQGLRTIMKRRLVNQKKSERRKRSRLIHNKIFTQKEFLDSRCVMLYCSKGTGEVDTGPIIKKALLMGKKVALPVTLVREKRIKPVGIKGLDKGLKKSPYGIYEPVESRIRRPIKAEEIDLVIVPGLAFDKGCNRLGHGQGYYDRFLKDIPKGTQKIGLGFRFQVVNKIPTTKNDISLTKVITD